MNDNWMRNPLWDAFAPQIEEAKAYPCHFHYYAYNNDDTLTYSSIKYDGWDICGLGLEYDPSLEEKFGKFCLEVPPTQHIPVLRVK